MKICLFRCPRTVLSLIILAVILTSGCKSKDTAPPISTAPASTDTTPPTVTSFAPTGDTVSISSKITATFSEDMDPASFSLSTFSVFAPTGGSLPGMVDYDTTTKTATFTPQPPLAQTSNYTVRISPSVTDTSMNPMVTHEQWVFTTETLLDIAAPTFAGITSATPGSTSTISLAWIAANDVGDVTPQNQLIYEICQLEVQSSPVNSGACKVVPFPQVSGTVTRLLTTAGKTTHIATGLKKDTNYEFVVRAIDLSSNIDVNTAQRTAKTFGDPVGGGTLNIDISSAASNPSIAFVGTTPYLTWEENPNVYSSTFNTSSWTRQSTPINAVGIGITGQQPRVVSDGAAPPTAFLTFSECFNNKCKVLVKKENSGSWIDVGGPLNIEQTMSATDSAIAFDSNNVPYVVWTEIKSVPKVSPQTGFESISHVFVKHLVGTNWILDGTTSLSLNLNINHGGFNPSIAIDETTINVSWKECLNDLNCEIHVKKWQVGTSPPTAATVTLTPSSSVISVPDDPSLTYNNGILYVSWHEKGKLHVRRDPAGSIANIEDMGFVVNSANNTLMFIGDGSGTKTATIAIPSVPYTRSSLATALKSALESANPTTDTYTVTFSDGTGIFTITNDFPNTNALTLLFGNLGTTAEEILGFKAVDTTALVPGASIFSDFDTKITNIALSSNTPMAGSSSPQGPYLAFVKVPNSPVSNKPELVVRLWNNSNMTWIDAVDGKLNMTTAIPSPPINASVAVSSSGSVFVAWVEAGQCLVVGSCGALGSITPQLYVKQLK